MCVQINSLSRWEIIDVIRNVSTQQAKTAGEQGSELARFARGGSKFTQTEVTNKFRRWCQQQFDKQNVYVHAREFMDVFV